MYVLPAYISVRGNENPGANQQKVTVLQFITALFIAHYIS